jgi:hypothetical protein
MDPANRMRTPNRLAVRLVRGPAYGANDFRATTEMVLDAATGLEWQRADDGIARSWDAALAHCAALRLGGHADWRLPDAKELHSIVDYGRIPAIDPVFRLADPAAYVWTSTTHLENPPPEGRPRPFTAIGELAVYFAFGPALGRMEVPPGNGRRASGRRATTFAATIMSAACAARAEARFGQSRPAASLFKRSDGGMDAGVSGWRKHHA